MLARRASCAIDPLTELCIRINAAQGASTKTLLQLYLLLPPDRLRGMPVQRAAAILTDAIRNIDSALYENCYSRPTNRSLEDVHNFLSQSDSQVIHPYMSGYPSSLQEIPDRPLALFVKGELTCLHRVQVAIVGSRRATPPAIRFAEQLGQQLAQAGVVVTSGLALGCDLAAHQGALAALTSKKKRQGSDQTTKPDCPSAVESEVSIPRAQTVAVLGCGTDIIYPAQGLKIARDIVDGGGCLISELNPNTPPLAHNFPRRNRIIAGLAVAVVVIEAGLKSGSLISARLANEYGREVFAVPGSPNNPQAKGCHQLLKSGAHLFETVADLSEVLGNKWSILQRLRPTQNHDIRSIENKLPIKIRRYVSHIGADGVEVDEFAGNCQLNIVQAHAVLMDLEVQGVVRQTLNGKYYKLV